MKRYTNILRYLHQEERNARFAFLQESINYEIYLRQGNQKKLSGAEFLAFHKELDGFDMDRDGLDFEKIRKIQRELESKRFQDDPSYKDWIIEDQLANPADL